LPRPVNKKYENKNKKVLDRVAFGMVKSVPPNENDSHSHLEKKPKKKQPFRVAYKNRLFSKFNQSYFDRPFRNLKGYAVA